MTEHEHITLVNLSRKLAAELRIKAEETGRPDLAAAGDECESAVRNALKAAG